MSTGAEAGVRYGKKEAAIAVGSGVLGFPASRYREDRKTIPALKEGKLADELARLDVNQRDFPKFPDYEPYRDLRREGKFDRHPVADRLFKRPPIRKEDNASFTVRTKLADQLWQEHGNDLMELPEYKALPREQRATAFNRLKSAIETATKAEYPRTIIPERIVREVQKDAASEGKRQEKQQRSRRPALRGL